MASNALALSLQNREQSYGSFALSISLYSAAIYAPQWESCDVWTREKAASLTSRGPADLRTPEDSHRYHEEVWLNLLLI